MTEQFQELLESLEIQLNQVFRFNLTHTINAQRTTTEYYAYFSDTDVLRDAFTKKILDTKKEYMVENDLQFKLTSNLLPGIETSQYQVDIVKYPENISNEEEVWNNYLDGKEIYFHIEDKMNQKEADVTSHPTVYVDGMGHIISGIATENFAPDTVPCNLLYNLEQKYYYFTDGTQFTTISASHKAYQEANEGTINDIKRKIYTGIIEIEPANMNQQLDEDEIAVLLDLQKKNYNYLCGTPTGELYAFIEKPKVANEVNLNTKIPATFKGWVSTYNMGNNIRSCGHKIATEFIPLMCQNKYKGIVIPKAEDTSAFNKMKFGFIEFFE